MGLSYGIVILLLFLHLEVETAQFEVNISGGLLEKGILVTCTAQPGLISATAPELSIFMLKLGLKEPLMSALLKFVPISATKWWPESINSTTNKDFTQSAQFKIKVQKNSSYQLQFQLAAGSEETCGAYLCMAGDGKETTLSKLVEIDKYKFCMLSMISFIMQI